MTSKISILPESLMKRIAAGEVVERPASVAKELMENSLDAGATSISLLVRDSGMSLIRVVDNGEGMTEEDALICCRRHATSKISRFEDLEQIRTLGFRGEALASISSVCRMVITARTEEETEATQIFLEADAIQEVLKVAANKGTSIEVKDIFYNVPVRRKFLKTPATELRHIISVFRRMALSHPEVEFSLFINGERTMDLRKGSMTSRIEDLMGERKMSALVPVAKKLPGLSIEGFVSCPGETYKSRESQFFFLNRRYIINRTLIHSVLSAYGTRLGKGEYPIYFLYIEMNPKNFDVNVHPTKIEVRFSDERFLHEALRRAIEDALRAPAVVPELKLVPGKNRSKPAASFRRLNNRAYNQLTLEAQRPVVGEEIAKKSFRDKEMPSLWQIHNRYILAQIKSGLTIIDQHVAHERILYERALASREKNGRFSQQLLFPQTVQLSPEDYLILTEIVPYLEKIGFGIKDFGKNAVVIEAVPVEVKTGRERELLSEIINEYRETRDETADTWDAVAKSFACKSAIKSGDRLSFQEMASLVDQLFATREPYFCPHGRPIVVNLTLEEIDKRFGR